MGRAIRTSAGMPARNASFFLLLFMVLLAGPCSEAKGQSEFQQDPSGLLVMEAERFQSNEGGSGVGPWQVVSAGGASSGKALKAPGGTFTGAPDTAVSEYRANFLVSDKYYLWVRFRAFDSGSDSMYVGLDSGGAVQVNPSAKSGVWEWKRALAGVTIAAGPHTVKLYRRESRLEVDRLLFTRNAGFSPTGIGPAENPLVAPADDGVFQQNVSGMLAMEAEHFDSNVGGNSATPWAVISRPDASNQQAIKAPAGTFTGSPDTARTEYRAEFSRSGTHYLWVRFRAFNTGSDSMYVELDQTGPRNLNPTTRNGEWEWKRLSSGLVIAAGEHSLKLYRRESNLEVDRLVISTSAYYVPSAEGPAESPRTAAGGGTPSSPNLPPSISGRPGTVAAVGQSYLFKPGASDPEGAPLSFGIKRRPAWATFSSVTGRLAGTPGQGDTGTYSNIAITVTDGENTAQLPAFDIQVVGQATGGFTLSWDPPLTNTDGSALTDLAGYRIYRGTQSGQYREVINVQNPGVTSYVFDQLPLGSMQFIIMTSVDTAGNESAASAEVSGQPR